MPEQHNDDNDARESHAQRRLRMAAQLAEQLHASPRPGQPLFAPDDRPQPQAIPVARRLRFGGAGPGERM